MYFSKVSKTYKNKVKKIKSKTDPDWSKLKKLNQKQHMILHWILNQKTSVNAKILKGQITVLQQC